MVIARICRVWSFGWIAALAACAAYLAAERATKSADLPPPTSAAADTAIVPVLPVSSYAPGSQFEARFGLFADGIGSAEQGTADLNGSFLTPRLNVGAPGYLAYLLPRFQLGGAVNLSGRTSFAYFDAAFTRRSRNGCSSSHSSAAPYIRQSHRDADLVGPWLSAAFSRRCLGWRSYY
jgi:hypothetical protein